MLSPVFFRPRPLGRVINISASGDVSPPYPGVYEAQVIGGGGGGSGSDTFYGRYGLAGWPANTAIGMLTFTTALPATIGNAGGGGSGGQDGGFPGADGASSSIAAVVSVGGQRASGTSSSYSGRRDSNWPDGGAIKGYGGPGGGLSGSKNGGPGGPGGIKLTLKG